LRAIAADPANRNQVRLIKKLQVHLSTGKIYAAQVKAYSPAINPNAPPGGQLVSQIFIMGYPGVVLNHDFLSRKSALEASVTVGRVSGFKIDITDRRVIQTDAAISCGNSGGPGLSLRVGAA